MMADQKQEDQKTFADLIRERDYLTAAGMLNNMSDYWIVLYGLIRSKITRAEFEDFQSYCDCAAWRVNRTRMPAEDAIEDYDSLLVAAGGGDLWEISRTVDDLRRQSTRAEFDSFLSGRRDIEVIRRVAAVIYDADRWNPTSIMRLNKMQLRWLDEYAAGESGPQPDGRAPQRLPDELQTPEAREYLRRAAAKELCSIDGDRYEWNATNADYGYFCKGMTDALNLLPSRDGAISWRPFDALFGRKRQNAARIAMNRCEFSGPPQHWKQIQELFPDVKLTDD